MTNPHDNRKRLSRRNALKALGVSGTIGLAGCLGDLPDLGSGSEGTGDESGVPSVEEGVEEWGQNLRDHAEEADINWQQFEDDGITLRFGMGLHKYSLVTNELLDEFEDHTGIEVEYDIFPEDEYWLEARDDLNPGGEGLYDGVMVGLWQAAELHESDVVYDLKTFIEDDSLTDQDWLQMDDFLDQTLDLMSFPGGYDDDDSALVGFPNGIEAYGCIGCDEPTFEAIDELADDPRDQIETFDDFEETARIIAESDATERAGVISRTSTTTLSSANFATMYRTNGGDWFDRSANPGGEREALVTSDEAVEALDRFGTMMGEYGPDEPGQYDWYRANDALTQEEAAMIYTTASTSGVISEDQFQQTTWLAPLDAPDGGDPTVATWVWSTGISQNSDNPEAAWLFIQWMNSRVGNYLLSTRQWDGHAPRAGTARLDFVIDMVNGDGREDIVGIPDEDPDWDEIGMSESWIEAHQDGMSNVPSTPPPVPVDTPQNMPIMTEVARAMNLVVRGEQDARSALEEVEPEITRLATEIDDQYIVR